LPGVFGCGSAALNRYLQRQARQDADKHVAVPFVLTAPPDVRALGYRTLSASMVNAGDLPDALARKRTRYPQLPLTLLGRLAVGQGMKGKGLGEFLLVDALRRSVQAAASIAAMAVRVDAKDEASGAFYRHFSFLPLHDQPRRLFLPMKTFAELLGS
jgi:GNAT superfamily N-acetyltransferase